MGPGPVRTRYLRVLQVDQGLEEGGDRPPPHAGRDPPGAPAAGRLGTGPAGSEPPRWRGQQVEPEPSHSVFVMAERDVPEPGPPFLPQLLELREVVDHRQGVPVDVQP